MGRRERLDRMHQHLVSVIDQLPITVASTAAQTVTAAFAIDRRAALYRDRRFEFGGVQRSQDTTFRAYGGPRRRSLFDR
jgi:hypothetical protein